MKNIKCPYCRDGILEERAEMYGFYKCDRCGNLVGPSTLQELINTGKVEYSDNVSNKKEENSLQNANNIGIQSGNAFSASNSSKGDSSPKMRAIVCEHCGSDDIVRQNNFFICQHCGTKYSLEEAKELFGVNRIENWVKSNETHDKESHRVSHDGNQESITTKEMIDKSRSVKLRCSKNIGGEAWKFSPNYRCGNDEFIIHSRESIQCSKCAHYYRGKEASKYFFLKEYSIENQQPILREKIKTEKAKLTATLYTFNIKSEDFSFKTYEYSAKIRDGMPANWIDIYITESGTPLIAVYLTLSDSISSYEYVMTKEGCILLIGDELPKFDPLYGADTSFKIPVKNPDQLVFTSATVGGITTGGFHTQSGGVHYETHTARYIQRVRVKAGLFRDEKIIFDFEPSRLDIYEKGNLPDRLINNSNKLRSKNGMHYYWMQLPEEVKLENRDYSNALIFDYIKIEDVEFKELIFGALSDEELYLKACELASKGTKSSLTEASNMFKRLGDYKDSLFKANDSLQKAQTKSACYVATAVYGSYDCPQVWTLRRFRDYTLAETWYGRAFIRTYYAISPTLVKWFGETDWFKNMWKPKLDKMVKSLNEMGVSDTPYQDRDW